MIRREGMEWSVIGGEYDRDAPNELGELSKESKQGRVKKAEWKIAIELWEPGFDNCKGDYISCISIFLISIFYGPDTISV